MRTLTTGRAAAMVPLAFSLTLALAACGADNDAGTPVGGGGPGSRTVDVSLTDAGCDPADLTAAAERYRGYVERQTDELVTATRSFVDAVLAGHVAAARRAYPLARSPYERIEPVARKLLADVTALRQKVRTVRLGAPQIANGANELLAGSPSPSSPASWNRIVPALAMYRTIG